VDNLALGVAEKFNVLKAAKSVTPYKFKTVGGTFEEECEDANISAASQIQGGVPGTFFLIIEFTNCKASFAGNACFGATAKSELLEGQQAEVVLPEMEKGGIATWFRSAEPNEVLFNLNAICGGNAKKYALQGSIAARYSTEYTETKIHGLVFPGTVVQVIEDSNEVPNEVGLVSSGESLSFWLTGEALLSLKATPTPVWGVF